MLSEISAAGKNAGIIDLGSFRSSRVDPLNKKKKEKKARSYRQASHACLQGENCI
jgi:hypothetical protein